MYRRNIVLKSLPYPNRFNKVSDVSEKLLADNQCSTRVAMTTEDSNKERR